MGYAFSSRHVDGGVVLASSVMATFEVRLASAPPRPMYAARSTSVAQLSTAKREPAKTVGVLYPQR